jgi:hypothetical protein
MKSVPPAVAGGFFLARICLDATNDPPATAGGTDFLPETFLDHLRFSNE